MSETEAKATLSMLKPLVSPGEPVQVSKIVQRLLAVYPGKGDQPDSVAEDWVRILKDEPLASIWAAYEKTIRRPGTFAPSPGDFLAEVQKHAAMVNRLRLSISDRT